MRSIVKPSEEILKFISDHYYVTNNGQIYRMYKWFDKPLGYITAFNGKDYLSIKILNKRYMAHHVCWFLRNGIWPDNEIDHLDGEGLNNSDDNLEVSDRVKQMSNRKDQSIYGVGVVKHQNGFMVRYKDKYIGHTKSLEDARSIYLKAMKCG